MKKKLLALLAKKQEARSAKVAMVDKSNDVAELRTLQGEVEAIDAEIRSIEAMIAEIKDEPENERTAAVNSEIPGIVKATATEIRTSDNDDMEYRKAFQQFVSKGTPIPAELREDANTLTTDIPGAIPTVLVNRIVEKLESVGNILPLFTKTSFASGVAIPTSSVKPVATWVLEGAGSDKQKKTTANITFGSFKLRCEISMSLETSVMALSAFENAFVKNVVDSMVKKIEATAISKADGTTSPKGILAETVATGQDIEIPLAGKLTYTVLTDAEAALPLAYESEALWFMTKKTFMGFIGMVDDQKQPIARVNYGLGGKPERILLGRTVILNDYMDSYVAAPAADSIVAFLFNPADYVVNTVYNMGVQRKQDWNTEDMLTKAVMILDGKVVDKNSLVTVTKKSA
jgi:HK97 family phage major capsid protein